MFMSAPVRAGSSLSAVVSISSASRYLPWPYRAVATLLTTVARLGRRARAPRKAASASACRFWSVCAVPRLFQQTAHCASDERADAPSSPRGEEPAEPATEEESQPQPREIAVAIVGELMSGVYGP